MPDTPDIFNITYINKRFAILVINWSDYTIDEPDDEESHIREFARTIMLNIDHLYGSSRNSREESYAFDIYKLADPDNSGHLRAKTLTLIGYIKSKLITRDEHFAKYSPF